MKLLRGRGVRALATAFMVIGLIGAGSKGAQAASDEERAAARSLADRAMTAFKEQRFADAIDLFQRAETLVHSPIHLLFLGRAFAANGQLVRAQEAFLKASREDVSGDAPASRVRAVEDAAKELEAIRPRLAELTIELFGAPEKPQVTIDGTAISTVLVGVPMPVDPGAHRVEAKAAGFLTAWRSINLAEGQKEKVKLELVADPDAKPLTESDAVAAGGTEPGKSGEPSAASGGRSPALLVGSIAGFALGAAGLAYGTVEVSLGSKWENESDKNYEGCYTTCVDLTEQQRVRANGHYRNSAISYAVGGVGLLAGGALLFLYLDDDEPPKQGSSITPWVGFGSAGVRGAF